MLCFRPGRGRRVLDFVVFLGLPVLNDPSDLLKLGGSLNGGVLPFRVVQGASLGSAITLLFEVSVELGCPN